MGKGRVLIRGSRVQDVGYRLFLLNLASESNLTGFQARNVDTDCIEALYEGGEEETKMFVEKVRELAPKEAEVSGMKFEGYEGPVKNIEVFRSEFTTIQLGKIVEIGLGMLGRQDQMLGKQDGMLGKQDIMLEKQDEMLGKMDQMLEKQDLMLGKQDIVIEKIDNLGVKIDNLGTKIDGLREDLKSMLDRRLAALEKDVALIKSRLGIA
ncbi:MAG: acylphosphatase [Thermoproteota archaeon]